MPLVGPDGPSDCPEGSGHLTLAVAGPVRETDLTGPRDTGGSAAWRTEIGWPVFRISAT